MGTSFHACLVNVCRACPCEGAETVETWGLIRIKPRKIATIVIIRITPIILITAGRDLPTTLIRTILPTIQDLLTIRDHLTIQDLLTIPTLTILPTIRDRLTIQDLLTIPTLTILLTTLTRTTPRITPDLTTPSPALALGLTAPTKRAIQDPALI